MRASATRGSAAALAVRVGLAGLASLLAVGCVGSPSPLTPGFAGSVGVPQLGVQTDGVELPALGTGFERYRPRGNHYWGRPRLTAALTRIAARIESEHPNGAPLVVGDLAARTGGKIKGHASHRTGRDVDLLFYVTTPAGAPVKNPGFVHFEADGLALEPGSKRYLRLDVERVWALVEALVTDAELDVQFLFVSRPLEALILDYAQARGAQPELVYRAQAVMLQPGDSTPHDDHFHLRVACSQEELLRGCSGGGPHYPWFTAHSPALAELEPALLTELALDPPPPVEEAAELQAFAPSPELPGALPDMTLGSPNSRSGIETAGVAP